MSPDIVVITETWLDSSIFDSELLSASYTAVRCDRKFSVIGRSTGGGVLIAFSDLISYTVVDTSFIASLVPLIDLVLCKCQYNHVSFYLAAVYVPPDICQQDFELFFESLEALLLDKPVLLLGDFILARLKDDPFSCSKCCAFTGFCSLLNLKQFNSVPT